MTKTTSNLAQPIPAAIDAGALDALINHALSSSFSSELGVSAEDAIFNIVFRHAGDDTELRSRVMTHSGFALGVEIARRVIQAPLADHSEDLKELVLTTIECEQEHLVKDRRLRQPVHA